MEKQILKKNDVLIRDGHRFIVREIYISNATGMCELVNQTTGHRFTLHLADAKTAFSVPYKPVI